MARDFLTQMAASMRRAGLIGKEAAGKDGEPLVQYEIEDDEEASTQRTSEDGDQQASKSQLNEPDLEADEIHSQTTIQRKRAKPVAAAFGSRISKAETDITLDDPSKIISDLFNYNTMAS